MAKKRKKASASVECLQTTTSKADMLKYETEDALRTIVRAEEIKQDSGMMARVRKMAKAKEKEMEKIAEIRRGQGRS